MSSRWNRVVSCMLGVVFLAVPAGPALAQIDNLTNMSAEWVRMSNRNAATDAPDIVVYNPAGTPALARGYHVDIANQFMFRKPEHSFDDPLGTGRLKRRQDSPDLFVPNLYAVYSEGTWALFGGVYIPGGTANLDYPHGSVTTRLIGLSAMADIARSTGAEYTEIRNERLEADSRYVAATIGAAKDLGGTVRVAACVRFIDAGNSLKGSLTLKGDGLPDVPLKVDVDQDAQGWGAVVGVMSSPVERLDLALHYETRVRLEFENDVKTDDTGLFVDGAEQRRDFPAMIGLGASYRVSDRLRCEADFNWFFQKGADWGRSPLARNNASYAGDVWSAGAAAAYRLTPDLEVSTGALYTKHEWKDIDAYYENNLGATEVLYSTNLNLSAGMAFRMRPGYTLNAGLSYTIWEDETLSRSIGAPEPLRIDTDNSTVTAAVGVTIFMPR